MKIKLHVTEKELRELVAAEFTEKTGHGIDQSKIKIMVKSKQNYNSEWEIAAFKAEYEGDL